MRSRDTALGLITTLILWQLLAWVINRPVLPAPYHVLVAFAQDLPGDLGRHFLISAWRVSASWARTLLRMRPPSKRFQRSCGPMFQAWAPLVNQLAVETASKEKLPSRASLG